MNKLKKSVSILLTVLLLLSLAVTAPVTANAETSGDWTYMKRAYWNEAMLTGYTGAGGDITIPSELDGNTVVSIYDNALKGKTNLTSVLIPETVTYIYGGVLSNCTGLTDVTIMNGNITIDNTALTGYTSSFRIHGLKGSTAETFASNKGYTFVEVVLPDFEYTLSGSDAVINKYNSLKTDVEIPDELDGHTVIGFGTTFKNNTSITSVTIPDSVTTIADEAFYGCSRLTDVTLGSGLTSIGSYAFKGCQITSVTIPNGVTSLGNYAFYNCAKLKSAVIGSGVTTIVNSAFRDCTALESVLIGSGVTSIGSSAFENCQSLTSVTIPDSVTSLGDSVFSSCKSLESINIPDGVTSIPSGAFSGTALTSVTISDSVTSIGYRSFDCGLSTITIGSGVTSIDTHAFPDYSKTFTSINVSPNNLVYRSEDGVLYKKTTLIRYPAGKKPESASFEVPQTVTAIDAWAFYNCKLKSITISDTVKTIGETAFYESTKLQTVVIPESVTSIGNYAFEECSGLLKIYGYNPSTAKTYAASNHITFVDITQTQPEPAEPYSDIDDFVFESAGSGKLKVARYEGTATEVVIPSSVKGSEVVAIRYNAFDSCDKVTSVTIPDSVTSIGSCAFLSCSKLANVSMPSSLNSLGDRAFKGCESLESITIPSGITKVEFQTFANCSSLRTAEIPNGVTKIDTYAFSTCSNLEYVSIPDSVTTIDTCAFEFCDSLENILIPSGVTTMSNNVFWSANHKNAVILNDSISIHNFTFYDTYSLTIRGNASSAAQTFAADRGFDFVALKASDFSDSSVFDYKVLDNGSVEITGYKGSDTALSIPMIIDRRFVTGIDSFAFANNSALKSVVLPETVKTIGNNAFFNCSNLKEITIPDIVETIGSDAFKKCHSDFTIKGYAPSEAKDYAQANNIPFVCLNDSKPSHYSYTVDADGNAKIIGYSGSASFLDIPSKIEGHTVTEIGDEAFEDILCFKKVNIPDSVTIIGDSAFEGCSRLETITIPDGVAEIGDDVFKYCSSLKSVEIPETVTEIGSSAFANCVNLTSAEIPYSVSYLGSGAFSDCTNLENAVLSYRLTSVNENLFYNCSNLKNIVIPPRVTEIGREAFASCYKLEGITIPDSVTTFGYKVFNQCNDFIIYGYDESEAQTYANSNSIKFVEIDRPEGDFIFADAGKGNVSLICYNGTGGSVTVPSTYEGKPVTIIDNAFAGCEGLTSVTIPNSIVYLESAAFGGCTGLTSISIPSNVKKIGDFVFSSTGLTNVTIPSSVKTLGLQAFSACTELTNVTMNEGVKNIGDYTFMGCAKMTAITLPDTIKTIGEGAFGNCSKLESATIGSGASSIGDYAFWGCTMLEHAAIKSRTAVFGSDVFGNLDFGRCEKVEVNGFDASTTETYALAQNLKFSPLLKINTGSGYTFAPLSGTQTKDNTDSSFGLNKNIFGNIELLGVQQKTDKGTKDMRFIAVVNDGIVNSATEVGSDIADYGFVLARTGHISADEAKESFISSIVLNGAKTTHRSCKFTNNTYSGKYGKITSDSKYKYVTMSVKDVPDGESFVVRFYIRTRSGKV
ncbi:MAG: leucine-rich repeat domain-containing protein, partial [Ruminococcus sp.]|nr:leucine-rich repeat domain-containing protein [Ruminococcus sp.]